MDQWGKLFDLATSKAGEAASIEVDPEDCSTVTLVWPDGTWAMYSWYDGIWNKVENDIEGSDEYGWFGGLSDIF
jgi:hypothetical protein